MDCQTAYIIAALAVQNTTFFARLVLRHRQVTAVFWLFNFAFQLDFR
jgi:hypothetical protein